MTKSLSLSAAGREVFVAVVAVLAAIVLGNVLADSRIHLLGGLLVGLRLGWFRSRLDAIALGLIVTLVASWLLVLPNFVSMEPLHMAIGSLIVIALIAVGVLAGRLLEAVAGRRPGAAPAAEST